MRDRRHNLSHPAPFTAQNIAVIPFRPPVTGIWPSGRRLSALWALAALGPRALATRLKVLPVGAVPTPRTPINT